MIRNVFLCPWPFFRLGRSNATGPFRIDTVLTLDKQAFVAAVAGQHGPRLRRFLAARLRNAADVPDLAQEVFLRLLRVQSHETIRTPEAYLLTIAGHVVHQHTLRQASAPEAVDIADAVADSEALSTPDSADELDAQRELADPFDSLSEKLQQRWRGR
jgi:DNA-directed RNA polymerase specialized sigma24 family protein